MLFLPAPLHASPPRRQCMKNWQALPYTFPASTGCTRSICRLRNGLQGNLCKHQQASAALLRNTEVVVSLSAAVLWHSTLARAGLFSGATIPSPMFLKAPTRSYRCSICIVVSSTTVAKLTRFAARRPVFEKAVCTQLSSAPLQRRLRQTVCTTRGYQHHLDTEHRQSRMQCASPRRMLQAAGRCVLQL